MAPISIPAPIQTAIEAGAVIVLSLSGGKDSQAMASAVTRWMRERRYGNQVVAVHADLGRAEWHQTPAIVEAHAERFGLELTIVQRTAGDMLDRIQDRAAKVGDSKPFWPSSASRYCTSDMKRGPIDKFLRTLGPLVISVEGVRAEESAARAKKPCFEERKQIHNSKRDAYNWRPILDWTEADVWTEIGGVDGPDVHPAYALGNERLSCSLCVLASKADLERGARHNPEYFQELVALEETYGWTFRPDFSLVELAKKLQEEEAEEELQEPVVEPEAAGFTYYVGEMSNGSAKLQDTYPRGIGRCFVERPIDPFPGEPHFLDNGRFPVWNQNDRDPETDYSGTDERFHQKLDRAKELAAEGRGPDFVVAPDRPGHPESLATSTEWIEEWKEDLQAHGVPIYLAVQDGMEPGVLAELDVLDDVAGLFLGGTDAFKDTAPVWRQLATEKGLRFHWARCTQSRIADAIAIGADSGDSAHPIRLGGDGSDPTTRWGRFLQVFDATVPAPVPPAPVCYYCGQEEVLDVLEVWGPEFMLETCCEGLHEAIVDDLNCPTFGDEAREEIGELVGQYVPCRQVYASESHGNFRIDAGLRLADISRTDARAFVAEHHRHNPPPAGDRWRHAVYNGSELVAVAIVGRPVARMIDHETTVEVNRLCVDHSLDRELTWKACSMLYRAAADEARERGFSKVITYTLQEERGMSLRYARWKKDGATRGGSWNRPSRARTDKAPTGPKTRWAKRLAA